MNQKISSNVIVVVIIVMLAGIVGLVLLRTTPPPIPLQPRIQKEEGVSSSTGKEVRYTPAWVVGKGDGYIIEKVGKDYFDKYYTLDVARTEQSNENPIKNSYFRYWLHYTYTALNEIGGHNINTYLQLNEDGNVTGGTETINDCVNRSWLCTFTVTKENARTIARENGFNLDATGFNMYISFASVGDGWAWIITQPIGSGSDCSTSKTLEINISNGSKFGPHDSTICM